MRIGLLGGSFNPPHEGHKYISKVVLKTMQLDAVWWLVTQQNPLKSAKDLLPTAKRVTLCEKMLNDQPRIIATNLEEEIGAPYSYETVKAIKKHFPHTSFSWITGMDNAHTLHHWQHWKDMLGDICMIHITRHPPVNLIKNCPTRMLQSQHHVIVDKGGPYPLDSSTTYWLLQKKMMNISSTEIRNKSNKSTT